MLRWLFTIAVVVVILGLVMPRLQQSTTLKKLPGDVAVRWRGRNYFFPFTTTILLSLLFVLVNRLF